MNRILFIFSYYLCIFALLFSITACSSPDMMMNYHMQKNDKVGFINVLKIWDDTGIETEKSPPGGSISMFSALQSDGVILSAAAEQVADKMGNSDSLYKGYKYPTVKFTDWKIISTFTAQDVPILHYEETYDWSKPSTDGYKGQFFDGPPSKAGPFNITDMTYFRYVGINLFFAPDSRYNTDKYQVYDKKGNKLEGQKETFMKRFHFYRFTGKGGGIVNMDNMLLAVDTYTKLVFVFGRPTKMAFLLGKYISLEWGPVDLESEWDDGKKYRFYEYDPVGYVTEDGIFNLTEIYKKNQAIGDFDPIKTDKSPYIYTVESSE